MPFTPYDSLIKCYKLKLIYHVYVQAKSLKRLGGWGKYGAQDEEDDDNDQGAWVCEMVVCLLWFVLIAVLFAELWLLIVNQY